MSSSSRPPYNTEQASSSTSSAMSGPSFADLTGALATKFSNVLRELEQKKPHSEADLAASASASKPSDSGSGSLSREAPQRPQPPQLPPKGVHASPSDPLLLPDRQNFELKTRQVEAWLARMEQQQSRIRSAIDAKAFHADVCGYKSHVDELNHMLGSLVSRHPNEDVAKIRRMTDAINQRYDRLFSSNRPSPPDSTSSSTLAALTSWQSASDAFLSWAADLERQLAQVEANAHNDTDDARRRLKDLQCEIDTERENLLSLTAGGRKAQAEAAEAASASAAADPDEDAASIQRKLDQMNQRWNGLKAKSIAIRNCLESNSEHWRSLYLSLRELSEWALAKQAELDSMAPIAGEEAEIKRQQDRTRCLRLELESRRSVIENNLLAGRQHLALAAADSEHAFSDASTESGGEGASKSTSAGESSSESRGSGDGHGTTKEMSRSIRAEISRLSGAWNAVIANADHWQRGLEDTLPKVHMFEQSLASLVRQLAEAERSLKSLPSGEAHDVRNQLKAFSGSQLTLQRLVEDVNDQATDFTANSVTLSRQTLSRLEDINTRWKLLQLGVDDKYKRLKELKHSTSASASLNRRQLQQLDHPTSVSASAASSASSSSAANAGQDFLSVSVRYPWARAVSQNKVPYYINHQTETTHWDHPDMVALFKSLAEFNSVRFSAYRTAAKLRAVQKKLALHLLHLNVAVEAFDAHGLRGQNDKLLDVADVVTVLSSLYETVAAANPTAVNVPLCLDLALNWMLNVFDCQRSGHIRVLSFKIAVTILCQGPLDEKYRYMFRLMADASRRVSERKLGLLLHDCVQVPRVLGEINSFGGNNVEPSVKSCFEKAAAKSDFIEAPHFLSWMKQEPQCIVWLPVLHRMIAAESARHATARCSICKQSPIVGFRYRCLKCFNFDMCQNCFFSGKSGNVKNHKMQHPMQEYCTTTTTGEDMRDFTKLLRNKFKSNKDLRKHSRLGYLPVEKAANGPNGDTIDKRSMSPHNSDTTYDSSRLGDGLNEVDACSASDESVSTRFAQGRVTESSTFADEHSLIAQYCQKLNRNDFTTVVPDSPMQIMEVLNNEQTQELEIMIKELESENANLQEEYKHLKASSSSFSPASTVTSTATTDAEDILSEAKLLREHRDRLESRMRILEQHNSQLVTQLSKLKLYLDDNQSPPSNSSTLSSAFANSALASMGPGHTGTLNTKSVTASQLATNSPLLPHKSTSAWREPPPALPPRGVPRDGSLSRGNSLGAAPPAIPPKRSSLTNSDLHLFHAGSTNSLPRRDLARPLTSMASDPSRHFTLGRGGMPSMPSASTAASPQWTDSLPRRDFYSTHSSTNSLPRRDKAGLGRPESAQSTHSAFGFRGRQSSLAGKNDHTDKRSSGSNLSVYSDNGACGGYRSSNNMGSFSGSQTSIDEDEDGEASAFRASAVSMELKTAAGDLGKELKNLITLMDQEDIYLSKQKLVKK